MSETNCNACNELRRTSPEFVLNGVTDTIAASLKNNTGFNPALTALHTNCEDLNDANDCLIARMDSEIESYEVCDWKEFMHKYLPNNYEVLKAIIAGDCGQWERFNTLEARIGDLCTLINQSVQPQLDLYGDLPGLKIKDDTARKGGEIMVKSGIPAATVRSDVGDYDSLGLLYKKMQLYDCSGEQKTYEWIQPRMHCYIFASNIAYNDIVWRVDKAKAQEWGFTGHLWEELRAYPQWWDGYGNSAGVRKECTMRLAVEGDYMEVRMIGSLGDMQSQYIDSSTMTPRMYVS